MKCHGRLRYIPTSPIGKMNSMSLCEHRLIFPINRSDTSGACYVIMSKAKGWYIVQRDANGNGNIIPDQSKSGWVPAGCLLELQAPIAVLNSGKQYDLAYPGLAPLPSSAIVSSSYPGTILMDWSAKAEDQATFKEGERVKVYKKYCHW